MVSSTLVDSIDWGTQVDTGQTNPEGDMVITYYFAPGGPDYEGLTTDDWTAYEQQQMELALATFEAVIDVEFVEVNNEADAYFEFYKVDSNGGFLGYYYPPGNYPEAGEGAFAWDGLGWDEGNGGLGYTTGGLEQGGYGFVTLIHELGHGLGLAHPHDEGGSSGYMPGLSASSNPFTDTADFDLNQGVFTTMSYIDGWETNPDGNLNPITAAGYGWQGTPMAIDIYVLQQKYGANEDHATGDDVYVLPDSNGVGTFFSCIWDAGGTDTMVYNGAQDTVIDLRAATMELEQGGGGWVSSADGIYGGYTIAYGVTIENATGGTGNDALVGNAADNELTGNAGADTFIFTGDRVGYDTITDFEAGSDIIDVSGVLDIYPSVRPGDVNISADAQGTSITVAGQGAMLEGVSPTDLGADDFVLT